MLMLLSAAQEPLAAPPRAHRGTIPLTWRLSTRSPEPAIIPSDQKSLYAACGRADASLIQVAMRSADKQSRSEAPFASDELAFTLRAAGSPMVWPRLWSIEGEGFDESDLEKRIATWAQKVLAVGERRCGVTRLRSQSGKTIVAAVAVDALADLGPLPTSVRLGEWLTARAHMLVPVSEAKVVLLGPNGPPKPVPASLNGSDLRATFALDQPGTWVVQVLATVRTGPRPILEAYVFVGQGPEAHFAEAPAPGEDAGSASMDHAEQLVAMVNAARKTEQIRGLRRDGELDELALAHAKLMVETKTVGHDVGDGDPQLRLRNAGIFVRTTGENVAAASTLARAHRALWASPSHRGNLLDRNFSRVGVGVVLDSGRVWVTQVFVGD